MIPPDNEKRVHGQTGEVGKDGILTPELQNILNQIQIRAAIKLRERLKTGSTTDLYPMVAMATGVGKGNIIHRVIESQMRDKPDSRILVVAGTKNVLVAQTHEALGEYQKGTIVQFETTYTEAEDVDEEKEETTGAEEFLQSSLLYKTGKLGDANTNVHVGTIQTVQSGINRQKIQPSDYDLVIVDEVHNIGTPKRKAVISQFKNVAGFTATPRRHSGRMKDPAQYGFEVVDSLPLPEAQNLRLLPPLVGMQLDTKDLIDEIPTTPTGKIDFKRLEQLLKASPDLRPYIADKIAGIISTESHKLKTVIAVNFVWEAEELARLLKDKGIKTGIAVNHVAAQKIDSEEIPALDSIERYKLPQDDERSVQVLISPYVASEGFDAPFTEALVWASPTDSSLRYTQYTGRLARRAPGKRFGLVIDCLYQTSQYNWSYNFGMWMKDDVKQLENGLLYSGPEGDINGIKELQLIDIAGTTSDSVNIQDLQGDKYIKIPSTDLMKQFGLPESTFLNVLHRTRKRFPDDFITKGKGVGGGWYATDEGMNILTQEITANRAKIIPISEGFFLISASSLGKEFKVSNNLVIRKIRKVQETLPNDIRGRGKGFAYEMSPGAYDLLRNLLETNDPNLKLENKTKDNFEEVPSGQLRIEFGLTSTVYSRLVKSIIERNPDHVVRRASQTPLADEIGIQIIRDELESYREHKVSREHKVGKIKAVHRVLDTHEAIQTILDTDFALSIPSLRDHFVGNNVVLRRLSNQAREIIQGSHSESVVKRKTGKRNTIIDAVTDRQLFIDTMIRLGAKPRE